MKLRQLSLFLENRPGQLAAPCHALAAAGIDILTLSLADTAQFGILRLIVRDWEKAKAVLEKAGMVVNVTEVVPVEVDDRPGGLASVLDVMEKASLGIEYMYAFAMGPRAGTAALIFRFEKPDEALALLRQRGIRVLEAEQLLSVKMG
jgi:hypothetical protein